MAQSAAPLASPADLIPFTEDGYPCRGRHLLTLDQVKAGFVDAQVFATSATRRQCWDGLLTYLQLWRAFSIRLSDVPEARDQPACLWIGGSFISVASLNPNNIDLTVFVDGAVLDQAEADGMKIRTQLRKLAARESLTRRLRVTPTIVRYHYPGTPWQREPYSPEQQEYQLRRGGMDDWWTRARPAGVPRGAPTADTGRWVRGYVEVAL
jgi:hypothetical protein